MQTTSSAIAENPSVIAIQTPQFGRAPLVLVGSEEDVRARREADDARWARRLRRYLAAFYVILPAAAALCALMGVSAVAPRSHPIPPASAATAEADLPVLLLPVVPTD